MSSSRREEAGSFGVGVLHSRAAVVVPLAIVLIWAVAWACTVPTGDIPLADDWIYGDAAKSIVETGRFRMVPFSIANVFAQAYWGALFCKVLGFSYEALRLSTFCLGE